MVWTLHCCLSTPALCDLSLPQFCLSPGSEALALSPAVWHCPDSFCSMPPTVLSQITCSPLGTLPYSDCLLGKKLAASERKPSGPLMKKRDWRVLRLIWLCSTVRFHQDGPCHRQRGSGPLCLPSSELPALATPSTGGPSPPHHSAQFCCLPCTLPKPEIVYLPFVYRQFLVTGRCCSGHRLGFTLF